MPGQDTHIGGPKDRFPTTLWGNILSAKDRRSKDYTEKIDSLISIYWKPVYKYIRIYWNRSSEDAKDLTQEFFTHFMAKDLINPASPDKGKFRTYVRHLLKHFLLDEKKKIQAEKRGGGSKIVSIESLEKETLKQKNTMSPDDFFDKEWAKCVIDRSIALLKDKLKKADKAVYFQIFEIYDLNHEGDAKQSYKEIAAEFSMKPHDVRNHLAYTRQLLRKIIKDEIANYVSDPDTAEDELKLLLSL